LVNTTAPLEETIERPTTRPFQLFIAATHTVLDKVSALPLPPD